MQAAAAAAMEKAKQLRTRIALDQVHGDRAAIVVDVVWEERLQGLEDENRAEELKKREDVKAAS